MQVHEVMSRNVKVIDSTATLLEAAEMMRDQDIGAIPVADANRPIGMLTDRDIVVRALADYRDPNQTRVRDIITPRLSTIYEDQDIAEAAALMAKDQVRRLLVIDHQQAPVGILSMGDLGKNDTGSAPAAAALRGVAEPHRELEAQRGTKP
jgi:CBS domain-containing protein